MAKPLELEGSVPRLPPDIMNDPQYATNTGDGEDGIGDVDTCRICRGEGSVSEPLFHPCKCSGSIKYVHQDCLMEWLSHSQKKHCELCKTPFRFTKLYSPNMPQTLPLHVLFRHVIIHTAKNVATWLRFCLVITVWLGFLPYIIRQVWRLLFWFSDGGWPPKYIMGEGTRNSTAIQALEMARELQLATLTGNGMSPVTPLHASQTTSASIGGVMDKLMGFLLPISQTLNISGADPLAAGLFKSLYYGFGIQSVVIPEGPATNASVSQYFMNISSTTRSPSLLSEITFLRNLTRYSSINQLIITIAEGYVITILVVVCFILVFLIREWVVQQQPGINMGAGFNAEFAAPERPRDQLEVPRRDLAARPVVGADMMANAQEPQDIRQRPMARLRRRNLDVDAERPFRNNQDDGQGDDTRGDIGGSQNRPPAFRDALTPAAEIQRALTEEPRMTEEFLAIWRRADSDPQEVLRIIEKENKGDQMRYWVNAMKILQNPLPQENGLKAPLLPPSGHSPQLPLEELGGPSGTNTPAATSQASEIQSSIDKARTRIQQESDESSASSESWVDIEKPLESRLPNIFLNDSPTTDLGGENKYLDKGKNKAEEDIPEPIFDSSAGELPGISQASRYFSEVSDSMNMPLIRSEPTSFASSSRPRSVSDGPQLKDSISPLANNNWSFSNLPVEDEKEDHTYSSVKENTNLFGPVESQSGHVPFENRDKGSQAGSQAWKAAQDLRVQQAIAKGREAHKSALERHTPAIATIPPAESSDIEEPLQIQGQDGIIRTAQNWDEVFENNPVSDSEDEDEVGLIVNLPEADPFQPDAPLPEVREPVAARPAEPEGVLGHIAEFLWGGLGDDRRQDDQGANDEHIVQDLAAEAPFVPVAHEDPFEQADQFPEQDREVVEAAIAAGLDLNDPDAMEDAEDFEGIMELVGMRGPIFSLVQNALFSAFLLALTVAFGVWIPYNIGRFFLLLTVNIGPACKLLLRSVFGCAALMQDLALSLLGVASYCIIAMCSIPMKIWSYYYATSNTADTPSGIGLGSVALNFSQGALDRIMDGTVDSFMHLTDSEIFAFSAASHESLMTLKSLIIDTLAGVGSLIFYIFVGDYNLTRANIWAFSTALLTYGWSLIASLPSLLAKPDTWVISLEVGKRVTPLDLELSVWDGVDRFWAILAGYTFLCLIGAAYVKKGSPFSSGQVGREWEATIIDLLNQAGGVMKVILIISIEMLVFPLYCGLLLDAALLPLFENTTIMSRILFTFKSPLTSIFVHWFVGTCYMFHFALFVSMCRKIMRKGVLYFIRDPDDPTFHPVRDVLERNVSTQLRKILFSALVYGGLVVICLGGVVWGLSFAFQGVLPIHWSSNEPVLEFPIDLLFYNFLMPLAVKFFKPSDGLHAMYTWWFRQCARMLRLTWFMFGDRETDEEGYNVRRTWKDVFRGLKGTKVIQTEDINQPFIDDPELEAYFRQDGRYVRAPASDQVRIPKGAQIFLPVDEANNRIDGKWDQPDGVHGRNSDLYKQVYIPPWFRVRIGLFILFIWLFAALTGVGITIVPLVFGRHIFAKLIPAHVRKNDVYAFSIGIYILGSALYAIVHLGKFVSYVRTALAINAETPHNVLRQLTSATSRLMRIAWTYTAFLFILPTLFTLLIEFYLIVPLHTYFAVEERHVMHFVQSWTLGLLYVKLTTRFILWWEDSRAAQSLRAITRDGYLNPDARLATRSFILPAAFLIFTALLYPYCLARLATLTVLKDAPEKHLLAYRYAYPMCLALCCVGFAMYILLGWAKDWRMKIRDEVYLIGERLHNFGDRKTASNGVSVPTARRIVI